MKKIFTTTVIAVVAFAGTLSAQQVSKEQRIAIQSDNVETFKKAFPKSDYDKCLSVKESSTTMLSYSLKFQKNKIANFLIANNADVNKACDGTTPLMNAAMYGNTDMLKTLISKGADKNKKNSEGKTAKQLATEMKQTASAAAL